MSIRIFVYMRSEQLYRGCEWNKVLVATAGEEVITLNVGHLGDAQGLIISLNASGFPMFSPYTHCWPMTHQPLYPHSKPLLHYLNREASCRKVGGQTPGSISFIISPSSYKWRTHDLEHIHLSGYCTYYAFFQHEVRTKNQLNFIWTVRLAVVLDDVPMWQNPELTDVTSLRVNGVTFVRELVCLCS